MRAYLHQVRISPKKASLVASMVRRLPVQEALTLLEHLPKKAAQILHQLISSAVANAEHNAGQKREVLRIKSLVVTKGPAYHRSIPMARGRARPIDKWTSHITVELGVAVPEMGGKGEERAVSPVTSEKRPRSRAAQDQETTPAGSPPPGQVPEHTPRKPPGPSFDSSADPHSRGARETQGGPTFQPHRRGGRGS